VTCERHRSRADNGAEQRSAGTEDDRIDLQDQLVDLVNQGPGEPSSTGQPDVLARLGM
jgi:hypothetical protein